MTTDRVSLKAEGVRLVYPSSNRTSPIASLGWQSILMRNWREAKAPVENRRVLNNINLHLKEGDRLGLAGRNGAGKTTLLKVLAGGLPPSKGVVSSTGKIVSLLNPQMGINAEATGYENILLRGLFLDHSLNHMRKIADKIIEFSELEDQIFEPVRTYSAGMRARLSFSILIHASADIILLDEWIGAGDRKFQEKAADRMTEFVEGAKITVLATHNERLLKSVCNKVATMEKGEIIDIS